MKKPIRPYQLLFWWEFLINARNFRLWSICLAILITLKVSRSWNKIDESQILPKNNFIRLFFGSIWGSLIYFEIYWSLIASISTLFRVFDNEIEIKWNVHHPIHAIHAILFMIDHLFSKEPFLKTTKKMKISKWRFFTKLHL